jgi:carboxypeptidase D
VGGYVVSLDDFVNLINLVTAYYNAGSAALSLLAIGLVVGLFFLCRQRRRRRLGHVAVPKDDPEEEIPLQDSRTTEYRDGDLERQNGSSLPLEGKMVFEVGDSDGEDEPHTGRRPS